MVCHIRGAHDFGVVHGALQQVDRSNRCLVVNGSEKHPGTWEEVLDEEFKNAYY